MEPTHDAERWSDYDSSSAAEDENNGEPLPEETNIIREMREQAAANRKRRAGNNADELPREQKRRRRSYNVQEQQNPPPPMSEGEEDERGENLRESQVEFNEMVSFNQLEPNNMQNPVRERDIAWGAEKQAQEDKVTREAHYKPALLPMEKQIEMTLLRDGEDQATADLIHTCLLCNAQKLSGVGLVRDNFNMLIKAMMDQITQILPQVLFHQLHKFFIERVIIQMREMKKIERSKGKEHGNSTCDGTFEQEERGEDARNDEESEDRFRNEFDETCTPYRFYRHFTVHTIDPTIRHIMSLWRVNEVIQIVESECLLEKHDISGRYRFNAENVLGYARLVKIRKEMYEVDPSKMLGFTTHRQLNTSKANPMINHHRPQFNPHSSLNQSVYPSQETPLLY